MRLWHFVLCYYDKTDTLIIKQIHLFRNEGLPLQLLWAHHLVSDRNTGKKLPDPHMDIVKNHVIMWKYECYDKRQRNRQCRPLFLQLIPSLLNPTHVRSFVRTPAGAQHETESQIPLSLTLKTTNGEWDGNTNSTVQDENIRKFSRFAHESPVFWTDTDALCRMISRIAPSPPL